MTAIPIDKIPPWAWAVAGLGAAWFLFRPKQVAEGALKVVGETVSGVMSGAGNAFQSVAESALGIPRTDKDKCAAARAKGDTFGTLTYCALIDDLIFGESPKATPKPPVKKAPAKSKVTLPGGGLITENGPSFNEVLNDPYGLGMSTPNYFMLNLSNETEQDKGARITPVAGIRG